MKKRIIKKVGVIGSGIMGAQIACHFANIGVEALLLDIPPSQLLPQEEAAGLSLTDPMVRSRIARENLKNTVKMSPSPLYDKSFANRIKTGNLEDDIQKLSEVDWIIEVVVERLDIKHSVLSKIDAVRKEGTLVSSNTSGIPIHLMLEGRSEDFRKHFCGTHFFNPPRYLQLLEIIPTPETDPEVVDFLMKYGDLFLGKTTVLAKDTPAFIANRIGVFGIMALFHSMAKSDLRPEEVDKLTGPVIGRPKSATFRTSDVVGLDTLVHVANGLAKACPNDERSDVFALPGFIQDMMSKNRLGSKTQEGFYKKIKNEDGSSSILSLDLETGEYREQKKRSFPTLELTRNIDRVADRFKVLISGKDVAAQFYREQFGQLFSYVSHRIPEISDEVFRIDDALRAGFGWEHGPFQIWDAVGLEKGIELAEASGQSVAQWVKEMLASGKTSFYTIEEGKRNCFVPKNNKYSGIKGTEDYIDLEELRHSHCVWKNNECSIIDLGDGILNFEIHSKMNTLGSGVLSGLNRAFDLAEKEYDGLVIGNQGSNFSAGANLAMIFMMATEQEWDELDFAIRYFQNSVMRVRYSGIPVVVAPHGLSLGGGCEMSLHADAVQAAAETYIGLVEVGVGVIPGGGGTKEMTLRAAERYVKDDVELNALRESYLTIGMGKVATSAHEAIGLGILQPHKDSISINKRRQLADAKRKALLLASEGYTQPLPKKVKVLGKQSLGMFEAGAHAMWEGRYISDHDVKISQKLAYIMSGGDLSEAQCVSEQYLLDLEREAFMSLCGERKTLERIQHMLKTGKPLRN
jgi:3-hydroxyacyl-CoA dehydrogenase